MKPKISIGLPVYNGENFLEQALDGLLNQTFKNFEIIISDNASTDKTQNICKKYLAKDSRIKYYRNKENLGAAKNYNRVFELSQGEYFKWASHDDVCSPRYLELCLETLESDPDAVLSHPKSYIIDAHGHITSVYTENIGIESSSSNERFFRLLETFGSYHVTQIFGLFRTEILRETALIRPYAHSDRVLLAELALQGKFIEVPEFLFFRRIHPKVSQIANPSDEQFSNWFDPNNKGKTSLARFQRYSDYFQMIHCSLLPMSERCRCYIQLLRRLFISQGVLSRLQGLSIEIIRRLFMKSSPA